MVAKIHSLVFMGIKKKTASLINKHIDKLLIYCLFFTLGFVIYKPAFSSFFFQDDWFTFRISQASNIGQFLNFFIPRTDIIYYRPIGMQLYFYFMYHIFGLNFFYYRLSTLFFYALNGLLVYLIFQKLKIGKLLSFLGGILFVSSAATYIPFFWSATFPFVLGPTFFFSSFLSYISQNKSKGKKASLIFYFLGFLTLENIVVLPVILFFWELLYNKGKTIKYLIFYLLPVIFYVYLRLIAYPAKLKESYALEINLLVTFRSYLFWSLNWPQEIARQMIGAFKINPQFLKDFQEFANIWLWQTLIVFCTTIIIPLITRFKVVFHNHKIKLKNNEVFSIAWFLIALCPLLLFASHTFPYYLPVPLFGLLLFFITQLQFLFEKSLFIKKIKYFYLFLIVFFWFLGSLTTISFNQLIHWAPQRALLSQKLINKTKNLLNKGDRAIIVIEDDQYRIPLNNQDAIQFLYGEQVEVIYGKIIDRGTDVNHQTKIITIPE